MPDLPVPRSTADEYLAAIHGVLGEIRDRLPAPKQEPEPGTFDVSEPAAKPAQKPAQKRTTGRTTRGGS